MKSAVSRIPLSHGGSLAYFTEVTSGRLPGGVQNPNIEETIRNKLGIRYDGSDSFPIEKIIVVPQDTGFEKIFELKNDISSVVSKDAPDVKTVRLPRETFKDWFEQNNAIIFTVVRFFLNGASIGATLIYSSGVPIAKAFLVGLLSGSVSGTIQYKIKDFRDWLKAQTLSTQFGSPVYDFESDMSRWSKEAYNGTLELTEEFGKFGITELGFTTLIRLAMGFLHIGNLPVGFGENVKNVFQVAAQSTFAQGVADLGLFTDLNVQRDYGGWSEEYRDIFRNAAALAISAMSVAVSAFRIANPGMGGEISLWLFDMPYGFAAVSMVGIGFYLHGLITKWTSSYND